MRSSFMKKSGSFRNRNALGKQEEKRREGEGEGEVEIEGWRNAYSFAWSLLQIQYPPSLAHVFFSRSLSSFLFLIHPDVTAYSYIFSLRRCYKTYSLTATIFSSELQTRQKERSRVAHIRTGKRLFALERSRRCLIVRERNPVLEHFPRHCLALRKVVGLVCASLCFDFSSFEL